MNKENCALKLVNEIILYYYARSKKHQSMQNSWALDPLPVQFVRSSPLSSTLIISKDRHRTAPSML